MTRRLSPLLLLLLLLLPHALVLAPALAQESGASIELSGTWTSKDNDLVVRRNSEHSWVGYPTEGQGIGTGRSWHFQALGGERFKFWILLEGKATTTKLHDQEIRISGDRDALSLALTDKNGRKEVTPWKRILAPVPEKIGEVQVHFATPRRRQPNPNQDIDVRLVRALTRAVELARLVDPEFKRLEVAATIDVNLSHGRRHSRKIRRALDISRINGAGAKHWREDIDAKLEALRRDETPNVDIRRDYSRHAAALVLALLLEDDLDEVICPPVLCEETIPYLEWWLDRHREQLPDRAPSKLGFRKRIDAMLAATKAGRKKVKSLIHIGVKDWPEPTGLRKKALDKKYDRE